MSWAAPWDRDTRPRTREDECDPVRRVGARFIDVLVLTPVLVVSYAIDAVDDHETAARVGWTLVGAAYEIGLVATLGRTVGKLATHTRILAADGSRVGWLQSTVRFVALFGPAYLLGYLLGPLGLVWELLVLAMVILHGLGPHDHVARTKVVTDIRRPAVQEVAPPAAPRPDRRPPRVAQRRKGSAR
jgi:uncharacterized RDD family membrane protein YckC